MDTPFKGFGYWIRKAQKLIGKSKEILEMLQDALRKLEKHGPVLGETVDELKFLIERVKNWTTGKETKPPAGLFALAIAAILYFLSPIDVIPDPTPGVGFVDDIGVVLWVIKKLREWFNRNR